MACLDGCRLDTWLVAGMRSWCVVVWVEGLSITVETSVWIAQSMALSCFHLMACKIAECWLSAGFSGWLQQYGKFEGCLVGFIQWLAAITDMTDSEIYSEWMDKMAVG